jgi:hypothetical protein
MSVAPGYPLPSAARVQLARRWELALIMIGLSLPIPLFAATGLSLPLPATVERLAAALVPWTNAAALEANQALDTGPRGSIVRAPGEPAPESSGTPSAAANPRTPDAASSSPARDKTSDPGKDSSGSGGSTGNGSGSGTGDGPEPPPPGGGDPTGPTAPVQGIVGQVGGATEPIVADLGDTVTGLTENVTGVTDTVTGVTDTVDGIVGSLGK